MGNLLYSLPLAPGQKKQIAVVDWERRETAARIEEFEARERLEAALDRDRDVSEIVIGHAPREHPRRVERVERRHRRRPRCRRHLRAGRRPARHRRRLLERGQRAPGRTRRGDTAGNALNQLRDRTVQSASSVRSQRSSVVQTVAQGERVTATTESVANYNHCHAITVQYFEVLRHLLVRQRLVDVQECLFVPLLMSWFTSDKALRWRNTLSAAVPRQLRERLRGARPDRQRLRRQRPSARALRRRAARDRRGRAPAPLPADPAARQGRRLRRRPPGRRCSSCSASTPRTSTTSFLREQQFKDRVFLEQLGPRIASNARQPPADLGPEDRRLRRSTSGSTRRCSRRSRTTRALYVSLRMAGDLPPVSAGRDQGRHRSARGSSCRACRSSSTSCRPAHA